MKLWKSCIKEIFLTLTSDFKHLGMNCIIIEDEPAAQSILEHDIALCSGLNTAVCSGLVGKSVPVSPRQQR
jgi:hypothetical protein